MDWSSSVIVLFLLTHTLASHTNNGLQHLSDCRVFTPSLMESEGMNYPPQDSLETKDTEGQSINVGTDDLNRNPCDCGFRNETADETDSEWIPINSSTCVKLLRGLHTYENALSMCHDETRSEADVSVPVMMNTHSGETATIITRLLRANSSATSVWVSRSVDSTTDLPCKELRVPMGVADFNERDPEIVNVDCTRLNSVMCQKQRPVPSISVKRSGVEGKSFGAILVQRLKQTEKQLNELMETVQRERNERQLHQSTITQLEKKLNELQSVVTTEGVKVNSRIDSLKLRVVRAEQGGLDTQEQINKLTSQIASSTETFNTTISLHQEETKRIHNQMGQLTSTGKREGARANAKLDNLERRVRTAEQEILESQDQINQVASEFEVLTDNINASLSLGKHEITKIKGKLGDLSILKKEQTETAIILDRITSEVTEKSTWKDRVQLWLLKQEVVQQLETLRVNNMSNQYLLDNGHSDLQWKYGSTQFDVDKALGVWNYIEVFASGTPSNITCESDILNRKLHDDDVHKIIILNQYTDLNTNERKNYTHTQIVDEESQAKWVSGNGYDTWLATDYSNWGIRRWFNTDTDNSNILILSRELTLSPTTLETLRFIVSAIDGPSLIQKLYDNSFCEPKIA